MSCTTALSSPESDDENEVWSDALEHFDDAQAEKEHSKKKQRLEAPCHETEGEGGNGEQQSNKRTPAPSGGPSNNRTTGPRLLAGVRPPCAATSRRPSTKPRFPD